MMLGYTASPTPGVKVVGRNVFCYFPAIDEGVVARLDSQLIIFEAEEIKQGKDDK